MVLHSVNMILVGPNVQQHCKFFPGVVGMMLTGII